MVALTPLPAPASTGRRRRAAWTLLRWLLGLASGALLFVLLAWLALHWLILPHIENWRPLIERESSKTIGVEVRIGSIEVRSSGWVPTLELRDVQLIDAHGRPTLELARVVASVSARSMAASLANLELRLTQLVIDGARIDARRDAAGRVFVAGLDMSGRSADGETTGAADWILHQGEIGLRGATLRWTDELRAAPALELTHVDLVVRNTLSRHALRLDATPPPEWGERFSLRGVFRQPLLERSGAWRRWSGQLYADAPRADVARLRSYLSLPFELTRGAGAMRAWLELREGEATALTLDVAVQSAELRLAAELEPLVVEQAHGRVVAERRPAGGASVALRGFGFVTGDRLRWPAGDLTLAWTRTRDGGVAAGEFAADRLDLAVVADTAGRLPLGAPVRKLLAETRPQGTASAVRASWSGPLEAPASYNVAARLDGVSIAARPADEADTVGRPGLSHVDLDLTATEKGGQARVAMKNGSLDLPGVFADPVIALDAMRAELSWRIEPVPGGARAVQVQVRGAQLANADAQGTLDATWSTGSGAARLPGRLELDGALSRGTATSAARYLPLGLPEGVRQYVQQAVQGGEIKRATFRVAGDLRDFPHFAAAEGGEFRVAIELEDVTLAYVPGGPEVSPWPPMTQGSGELVFNRNAFEFRAAHANVLGVALSHLHGGIRDLTDNPLLTLDTQAQGPLADMLRFVIATPGGDGVRTALRDATASGDAKLQLALRLPLHEPDRTSVAGSLTLSGNDLRLRADLPALAATRGRVDFTTRGFTLAEAKARLLGGEVAIDGGMPPGGALRLSLAGRASAEALRQTPELGALARAAGALAGQASYRFAVGIDDKGLSELDLTSDLAGMALDLPAPLAKRADASLPLHVRLERVATPAGAAPQDRLRVELGDWLRASYLRGDAGGAMRVISGGIGVNGAAPTPASGVAALLDLASLDVAAWDAAATRLFGAPPADAAAPAGAGYLPDLLALQVQTLSVAGQRLTKVAAGLSRLDGQWRANVDADQLSGYIEYRPASGGGATPGRVHARLARLALERGADDDVTRLLDRQPASVPALDVTIEDLKLRGRGLGRLELQAVNRTAPQRQWELLRLNLALPEAEFNATGRWVVAAGDAQRAGGDTPANDRLRAGDAPARVAEYRFELDIADSGALLRRFGSPDAVRGGKGTVKGTVRWLGTPLQPDFETTTGRFNVAIEQGVFLHSETGGAARLLGVLSLQGLLRRLTFDFRDLSEDGFAFDSVTGDVAIERAVASTNNLVMRGAHAAVLLEGSADANDETENFRVFVVPDLDLGAASLAYAMINPVIGLSTFAAQLFLREPLAQAYTREFRVFGSWSDPQIETIERRLGQAPPHIGAAAASAASAPSSSPSSSVTEEPSR